MGTRNTGVVVWFNKRIVDPFYEIIHRGAEPKQLAFSAAFGFSLGIFPICGVTIFLCGIAIAMFGPLCHAPTLMLANFIATPIELSLLVPFLRLGEAITGGPHFPLTSDALRKVLTGQASHEVALGIGHALLGWLVAAPFVVAALYVMFLPFFGCLIHRIRAGSLSAKKTPRDLQNELGMKSKLMARAPSCSPPPPPYSRACCYKAIVHIFFP